MQDKIIQNALTYNELFLNKQQKRKHFTPAFAPLVLMVFAIVILISPGNKTSQLYFVVFASIVIIGLIIFLLYRLQKRRLQFLSVQTSKSQKQLIKIIKKVGKELEWHFEVMDKNYVFASTRPGFSSGSWGEQITIVLADNQVLVNSICDLEKQTSLVSMGRNRKNMETLIDAIKKS